MKILSRQEMRDADAYTIETIGVPGIVLMERAALALQPHCTHGALILCGGGNNGGDGLALARLLHLEGKAPRVLLLTDRALRGDALTNFRAAQNIGVPIRAIEDDENRLQEELDRAQMVVDCIFGTGLDRPIEGPMRGWIARVNASGLSVLSCDIPSGIDADTGEALGIAVRAQKTVTLHAMKRGLLGIPNVQVADIGIVGEGDLPDDVRTAQKELL